MQQDHSQSTRAIVMLTLAAAILLLAACGWAGQELPVSSTANSYASDFDPSGITLALEPVQDGFQQPVFATHAGDESGRLFVVEKGGTIRIVADGQSLDEPLLDIRDRVNSRGSEQGLLGLAFAPDFRESGHLFVNYIDLDGNTIVARYQVRAGDANRADPESETIILEIEQPAGNHNGGMLAFGPDGYLYIGTGDGGGSNDRFGNAQNRSTLLGKLLRIDVSGDSQSGYTIPDSNPWANTDGEDTEIAGEIWALGLRNPWRFSFDQATGDLWIGDVGQNQFEEIDLAPAGVAVLNFGWPHMEGRACHGNGACAPERYDAPVVDYEHAGQHCSVIGGYVYRGADFVDLQGVYFYADLCSGMIWALAPDSDGDWTSTPVLDTDLRISSFGEDEAGELYITDIAGGELYRLTLAPEHTRGRESVPTQK